MRAFYRNAVALCFAVAAACSPKLNGAHCITDSNCPSEQTCVATASQAPGLCQPRPTCKEDCKASSLVCGFASGQPACQCPANRQFLDGGYILTVSPQGSPANADIHPTGTDSPGNCSFQTLSDAVDLANLIQSLSDGGPSVTVKAQGTAPILYGRDERFPITLGAGVQLTGSLDPSNRTGLFSKDHRQLVKLMPGSGLDSFVLTSQAVDGEPVLNADCLGAGGPILVSNLLLFQPDAGLAATGLDAGANTGFRVTGSCQVQGSGLQIATLGYGLSVESAAAAVQLDTGTIAGQAAGLFISGGTLHASGVEVLSNKVGISVQATTSVNLSFGDGGIMAPSGLEVGRVDGGSPAGLLQVAVLESEFNQVTAGVSVASGRVDLNSVKIAPPAGALLTLYGVGGTGADTSIRMTNVDVRNFAFGLILANSATANLQAGTFDHNDVSAETITGAGFQATGTAFTNTGYQGVIVSSGTVGLHGVTVSSIPDAGAIGISATGSSVTLDGPTVVQGFVRGVQVNTGSLTVKGDSMAAPVRVIGNIYGLDLTDTSVDARALSITGVTASVNQVVLDNGVGADGGVASFQQCAFNGVGSASARTFATASFSVAEAYPSSDGGMGLVIADSVFSGGGRGLDLGPAQGSGSNVFASVSGTEFKTLTSSAVRVNGAAFSAPGSAVVLQGNSIHGNNTLQQSDGAVVLLGTQPTAFQFGGNKVFANRGAQVVMDYTSYGPWQIEAPGAACASANQFACYGPGLGLSNASGGNGSKVSVRNASWTNATPGLDIDYSLSNSPGNSVDPSTMCPASTLACQ